MEKQLVENLAPHSVQLTTNAKGKVQLEIKVYSASEEDAAKRAVAVLKTLRAELAGQLAE